MNSLEVLINNARVLEVGIEDLPSKTGWRGRVESEKGWLPHPASVEAVLDMRDFLSDFIGDLDPCTNLVRVYAEVNGFPKWAVAYLVKIAGVMGFARHYNCACPYIAHKREDELLCSC